MAWWPTLATKGPQPLRGAHLRFAPRERGSGVLHCFVLDCSASMLAHGQLALAKGLLIALFDRARRERAEAALICFGGDEAHVRFGPAVPRWWNERWLEPVGAGGGTPLGAGIDAASRLLDAACRRKPAQQRVLWLMSDGRSTQLPVRPRRADHVRVVDLELADVRLGRCDALARAWGGECVMPETLLAQARRLSAD
ncbi:magnesium chelatase [Burkholderia sp. WAC0059]|nr:magnesium chelatase [Burkholderia sp. WAC0059]